MPLVKVPRPKLGERLKRFFLADVFKGMWLTLKFNIGALTDKNSVSGFGIYTEQYPKVRPQVAPRFHGAPRLNMDPETHEIFVHRLQPLRAGVPRGLHRRHRDGHRDDGRRQAAQEEGARRVYLRHLALHVLRALSGGVPHGLP